MFLTNERFLLARLYMDLLCQIPTKRGVRRALAVLPDGIDKTYSEAWDRVCTQNLQKAELGKRILSWIIHATRPLRVQELRHALAIEENDEEIDPDGLLDVPTLTSFCAGLVIVDEQRGLFSLVHPTTQEYFDKHKDILFPAAHENIAATCITYLHMKPFRDEGALDDYGAFYERRCTCHLLGYAAVNWGFHAAMAGSEKAKDDSLSLINNESVRAAAWQALELNIVGARDYGPEWPEVHYGQQWGIPLSKSFSVALNVAAYFGLISVVQTFLELGIGVNQLDGTGRTPLHWAIIGKQNKMLQFLLKHGADANAEKERRGKNSRRWDMEESWTLPLVQAACLDNFTAIECLLHHGAEINKISRSEYTGKTSTALSLALHNEWHSSTQVLLENGADVNVDLKGLTFTAKHGSLELLKMAVDAGASNYTIQQALASAAAGSNYDAIVFLVEHGANANGFGKALESCNETDRPIPEELQTPLVASAADLSGTEDAKVYQCFQYLLEAGASVDHVCARLWYCPTAYIPWSGLSSIPRWRKTTALHTAAYHGRLDMVRIRVERGADVNFSLGEQLTALSSALGSEGHNGRPFKGSKEFGSASILRVRATIKVLEDLGADRQLCKDEEIQRIETLLQMSLNNCKMVAALPTVVETLRSEEEIITNDKKRSFRDRVSELKELIAEGANPDLCCHRDKKRIGKFLAYSDKEIDTIDEEITRDATFLAEWKKGPI